VYTVIDENDKYMSDFEQMYLKNLEDQAIATHSLIN
jgi:hypothetical protein